MKIKIKAIDAGNRLQEMYDKRDAQRKQFRPIIDKFMISQGYTRGESSFADIWRYTKKDEEITALAVFIDRMNLIKRKTVRGDSWNYEPFTKVELRFFDNLGFVIESNCSYYVKQSITDWWTNKALDGKSRFQLLNEGLMKLGYDTQIEKPSEGWLWHHKTEDVRLIYYAGNRYRGDAKNQSFDKKTVAGARLKFTRDELLLFDNLGFRLHPIYSQAPFNQNVDDWFKANDAIKTVEDLIEVITFFYNKRWSENVNQSYGDSTDILTFGAKISNRFKIKVYVDTDRKKVSKYREDLLYDDEDILKFSDDELRFFDNLGYELDIEYDTSSTKQKIDDWFKKKANDKASMADIKRKLKERYLAQGYEISFEGTKAIHFTKQHPDNKSIYRFYLGDMAVSFEGLYRGVSIAIKLSNEELKFLDNLGFEISKHDTQITEQTISDWFKAHDADSSEFRIAQYFSNKDGWTFELYNEEKKMVGHYNLDGFTEYVLTAYSKDYQHNKLKGTVNKKLRNLINDTWDYTPMTSAELRFFDNLGFVIYKVAADITKQTIDDWFKAQDIDMFKAIEDFVVKKNKGKEIFTDTKVVVYMIDETTSSKHIYETQLYVTYRNKTVYKYMYTLTRPQAKDDHPRQISEEFKPLTFEELRFFDNLGFEIEEDAAKATKQDISDWFKNKASDAIDLSAVISDFMQKNGYEPKRVPSNKHVYMKEFYDGKYRDTRFNYFTINLREPMTVEKTFTLRSESGREFYDDFNNKELKFFDNLGFVIDPEQTETLNQKIDDWWVDK